MPPPCNIDARGKRLRYVLGLLLLALGLGLCFLWALARGGHLAWVVTAACWVSGAFLLYEARAGWCALRALGFKTPV
jgi:hypothetical protein